MNVCIYTSGYGFGHATRDIAILRSLKTRFPSAGFFVRTGNSSAMHPSSPSANTSSPLSFMRASLPFAKVSRTTDFFSAIAGKNLGADTEKTFQLVRRGLKQHRSWLDTEKNFCRANKITLILSDISPHPFALARELGIPSFGCSNFTWHLIYENLFAVFKETDEIARMYALADRVFALPLREPMRVFRHQSQVPLLVRRQTHDRSQIRKLLGISNDELLVYVGAGFSTSAKMNISNARNFHLLTSGSSALHGKGIIRIPQQDTETQDYIAACDLVVTKASYGLCSEAMAAKVPMILCERAGFHESKYILAEAEKLGVCLRISEKELLNGKWTGKMRAALQLKKNYSRLPRLYQPTGAEAIARSLSRFL